MPLRVNTEAITMTELLAPAGDFQSALTAFNAGADAIYTGLKRFSARKSATNLTLSELSRIKNEALKQNKKIYIAFNTLIKDSELEEVYKLTVFN